MNTKFRIGIMCVGDTLATWEYECIERLLSSGMGELALFIKDDPANYQNRGWRRKLASVGFNRLGFQLYMRFLCRPRSYKRKKITHWMNGVDQISCAINRKGKHSQYFKKENIENINSYNLDIIFRFGFNIIRGEILNAAKYGVWSFHHDDEMKYRGAPPCFWEIYNNDYETGSILQRLTDRLDGGIVLKKGIMKTKLYSYAANIDQAYFETAKWPLWVCNEIRNNEEKFQSLPVSKSEAPIYRHPTNLQLLYFFGLLFRNVIRAVWSKLFMQKWNVAVIQQPIQTIIEGLNFENAFFLSFKNRKTFNADCFGLVMDGKKYIFFEELDYGGDAKGQIRVSVLDKENRELERVEVEGLPDCHLSYPFIYEEDGKIYMIPETAAINEAALYEAIEFPKVWKKKAVLLNGEAYVDTTLFVDSGKQYWLFYSVNGKDFDGDLHLHIAYADNLLGPYHKHPLNPVKVSARSARPAGNLFMKDNMLYRPGQNFTKTYGGSIVLNKVETLTGKDYCESEIIELKSDYISYKNGIHTIGSIDKEYIIVDLKRFSFKF